MVLRTEENLRNFSKILTLFHTVSGLKCNLDKTFVIPVGNFAKGNMCQDLNLKWMDSFTVLGITIDNRLQELQQHFQRIHKRRITVAKSLLLSQFTYGELAPGATSLLEIVWSFPQNLFTLQALEGSIFMLSTWGLFLSADPELWMSFCYFVDIQGD